MAEQALHGDGAEVTRVIVVDANRRLVPDAPPESVAAARVELDEMKKQSGSITLQLSMLTGDQRRSAMTRLRYVLDRQRFLKRWISEEVNKARIFRSGATPEDPYELVFRLSAALKARAGERTMWTEEEVVLIEAAGSLSNWYRDHRQR